MGRCPVCEAEAERDIVRAGDAHQIAGLDVTVAARISAMAGAGQILVSRTVRDLVVGSGIHFTDYGTHSLKGLKKDMHLYEVESTT